MTRAPASAAFVFAMLISAGCSREPPPVIVQMPPTPRIYPTLDDGLIRIFFDFDSTMLSSTAEKIVDNAAAAWKRCPDERITIAGHTDQARSGSRAIDLSRRRAEIVRAGLIARGGDPHRIVVEAYGASRPAVAVRSGAREPFNRRIEIAIPCLKPPAKT